MNRVVELVATPAVALRRFDHAPGLPHRDPDRERAAGHGVHFVEAGAFRVRTLGPWRALDVDSLLVTNPALELSFAHDEEHPTDACLTVAYSDQAIESARAFVTPGGAPVRPLTNRLAFLRRALGGCAPSDSVRFEALAGELLGALSTRAARQPLYRPERFAWYAARVERAKALMEARHAEPLSLSILARDAGMSLFHFARVFGELEGRPPHRHLIELRLARARARLLAGAGVTDTCLAVGFGSLSHFVSAFRRRFGVRPSEVRRG